MLMEDSTTKAKSPQTNGICESFNKIIKEEFYATTFRKKVYDNLEYLQHDLNEWLVQEHQRRPHSGRYCYVNTPHQTWRESLHLTRVK